MKPTTIILILLISLSLTAQRNILQHHNSTVDLERSILSADEWYHNSVYDVDWENVSPEDKAIFIARAENDLEKPIPTIPASLLMEYSENGNRSRLGEVYFKRRFRLVNALIAEKIECQGRFMSEIVDLAWALCEESTWVIPAHYYQYGQDVLPNVSDDYVDLFAGETGALLAWTHFLLKDELDQVTPIINQRILKEIDARILKANIESEDYHWMGYKGEKLNNWTPWICSNWLTCVLLCEDDKAQQSLALEKICLLLDRYMNPYPADGGCDEGPLYWEVAGANLYDCLFMLDIVTNGAVAVWDKALIKNIGSYIYKVYIDDHYFVNFADAATKVSPDAAMIYRFGESLEDKTMMAFAAKFAKEMIRKESVTTQRMGRLLPMLSKKEEIQNYSDEFSQVEKAWLPDLQVATFREKKGFFVAAKGGHNNESHNHNDVGSFVIYYNGSPLLIDAGVETYTEKTFSDERYEIWTMQSQYHNLPTINGVLQRPGEEFKAMDVAFMTGRKMDVFSLDLSGAYPPEAEVTKWKRSVVLDKKTSQVVLSEDYQLASVNGRTSFNFMTDARPQWKKEDGRIILSTIKGDRIKMSLPDNCMVEIETCDSSDPRVKNDWGDEVYCIIVTPHKMELQGNIVFAWRR